MTESNFWDGNQMAKHDDLGPSSGSSQVFPCLINLHGVLVLWTHSKRRRREQYLQYGVVFECWKDCFDHSITKCLHTRARSGDHRLPPVS